MKKLILSIIAALVVTSTQAAAYQVVDVYNFKMILKVPRVYDNMQSLGYRKYQTQLVTGTLKLAYKSNGKWDRPTVVVSSLVNKSHKLSNGKHVTYDTIIDTDAVYPRFNVIGNNKTCVFKKPSVVFAIAANPSYNIGDFVEDNGLYLTLAGSGITRVSKADGMYFRRLSGYAAGTIGCGCMAYGHVSPCRVMGFDGPILDYVDDVAAVYGHWSATYTQSYRTSIDVQIK